MKLRYILIVGVIVRIMLMPFFSHPVDVYYWYSAYMDIVRSGAPTYIYGLPWAFPPLWYYIMTPFVYIYDWLSTIFSIKPIPIENIPLQLNPGSEWGVSYVPGLLFNTVIKIPFLISDFLVALLLYKIVKELTENQGLAEKASLIWFLNPYLIWISSGWGMFDTIPTLFTVASFFFLIRKNFYSSSICLALAVASKLYPALFLIPLTFYLVKTPQSESEQTNNLLKFYLTFIATSIILFLPFLLTMWSPVVSKVGGIIAGSFQFSLTYWAVLFYAQDYLYQATIISLAIFSALLILISWKIRTLSFKQSYFELAAAMLSCILIIYLSIRTVVEQFFVWALPFIIILCLIGSVKEITYWAMSLIAIAHSIFNCLFPRYLLAVSPWFGNTLVFMMQTFDFPGRVFLLIILGISFSALATVLLKEALFERHELVKASVSTGAYRDES